MKLSLWNIYEQLSFPRMEARVAVGSASIQYVRLLTGEPQRRNTVYVGDGSAVPGGHGVAVLHREDAVFVDGAELFDVFNRVAAVLDRCAVLEKRLTEAELPSDGVDRMLEAVQQLLPGAYLALTSGGKTLGLSCAVTSPLRPIWDEIGSTRDLSYERLYTLDRYIDFTGFLPRSPLTTRRSRDGSFYVSCRSVESDGNSIGFLAYCGAEPEPPKGVGVILDSLAEHVARFFREHLDKLRVASQASEMLQELLDGGPADDEVRRFFAELGWQSGDEFQLFAVSFSHQGDGSEVIRSCRSLFRMPLFCGIGQTLMILVDRSREHDPDRAAAALRAELPPESACGVSVPFRYLFGAALYRRQAEAELQRARKSRVRWSEAGRRELEQFRSALLADPLSRAYINRSLIHLLAGDIKTGTNYYDTMRAYVLCGYRVTDAARLLGIHRNTFLYRLDRIRELIDFSEFDEAVRQSDTDRFYGFTLSLFLLDQLRPSLEGRE